ncbi:MAG TPA: YtxH domain-containing protein [Sphingobacteriaceae bacterium]|nr:YtxH domain-containing protein [Sphingobacteriaceae bacterium]
MKSYNSLLKGAKSLLKDTSHIKSRSSDDNGNIVAAAIIGLAAGAILGILLAPERGSETRNYLSNSLGDLGSAVRDKAKQGAERFSELKDKAVETVRSKVRNSDNGMETEIETPNV